MLKHLSLVVRTVKLEMSFWLYQSSTCNKPKQKHPPHLSEWLVELPQDALFVKHLALVAMLIVVMDSLPHICRKLVERHVLLDLFVLQGHRETHGNKMTQAGKCTLTKFIAKFSLRLENSWRVHERFSRMWWGLLELFFSEEANSDSLKKKINWEAWKRLIMCNDVKATSKHEQAPSINVPWFLSRIFLLAKTMFSSSCVVKWKQQSEMCQFFNYYYWLLSIWSCDTDQSKQTI